MHLKDILWAVFSVKETRKTRSQADVASTDANAPGLGSAGQAQAASRTHRRDRPRPPLKAAPGPGKVNRSAARPDRKLESPHPTQTPFPGRRGLSHSAPLPQPGGR